MTYRHGSWLVKMMNKSFKNPPVTVIKQGRASGAVLTASGKEMVALYRTMERRFSEAVATQAKALELLVGDDLNAPAPIPREAKIIDPATIRIVKKPKRSPRASTKQKREPVKSKLTKKSTTSSRSATRR
ncbi:MAG: hypothetical protein K5821_15195 [Nitrobacter sp.]|nr:hypothetical protein [Nitrobacter sp.]